MDMSPASHDRDSSDRHQADRSTAWPSAPRSRAGRPGRPGQPGRTSSTRSTWSTSSSTPRTARDRKPDLEKKPGAGQRPASARRATRRTAIITPITSTRHQPGSLGSDTATRFAQKKRGRASARPRQANDDQRRPPPRRPRGIEEPRLAGRFAIRNHLLPCPPPHRGARINRTRHPPPVSSRSWSHQAHRPH